MKKGTLILAALALAAPQLLPLSAGTMPAKAQEVGKLYAAKPPQGSAFIRIISAINANVVVEFGSLEARELSTKSPITDFRLMKGGVDAQIFVDGKKVGDMINVPEDSFMTLLLWQENEQIKNAAIVDQTRGHDDLKAELRLYNLVPGCNASLALADGPDVFKDVAPGTSMRRSINPVSADLLGKCAAVTSNAFSLPSLKAGDRFSLFLTGSADKPALGGQTDRTVMPGQ
ncbi:alginate O-acetyltransferase AlgF [Brucella sp. BE17]|uniref:alginate O-acetyltransferase AlgF n=1 Tax=Brucella sp. BE17 TaxID=3142977 RepID=UPI0031B9CDB1